jgi:hypothetical protein
MSLILAVLPKTAVPAALLASALRVILQELGSQLLRFLQLNEQTWESADPAVSVENGG